MCNKIDLGNIKIFVEDTVEGMGTKAAEVFSEELIAKPNGVFGFATGSTPVEMYKALIKKYQKGEISFANITSYNLDEYYPIKRDNDQSYYYFMMDNLFGHIDIKKENINLPNGEAPDPIIECEEYEAKVRNAGGTDMQILGIGENGHIAFNEPSDCFTSATNYTSLTKSTISANARFFESIDDVPKKALTMGIKTIMLSKKIILVANSAKKAKILDDALFGKIEPKVPASALQLHQDVTVVVDKEAAKVLIDNNRF